MWEFLPVIFGIISFLIIVVIINSSRKKNESLNALIKNASDLLGFKFKRGNFLSSPVATVIINGTRVSLRSMAVTDGKNDHTGVFRVWIHRHE